jgi:hypothetical protein
MEFILFALSAIGFVFLIICIFILVAPYIGWNHKHSAAISQIAVDIPKTGRYSINIRRDRFWLLKGHGNFSNVFPKVDFWIMNLQTGEAIRYSRAVSLFGSTGTGTVTMRVGHFDVFTPGKYLITSHPESQFLQDEEILIRKFASTARQVLTIIGIVLSSFMFMGGLILGILILTGNLY